MPITEEYNLILSKTGKRTVADKKINGQVGIVQNVITRSREVQGWAIVPNFVGPEAVTGEAEKFAGENGRMAWNITGDPKEGYQFEMYLKLRYHNEANKEPEKNVLDSILNGVADVASKPTSGTWTLSMVEDKEFEPFDPDVVGKLAEGENLEYAPVELPDNIMDVFNDHLFGLDDQIARVLAKVRAAIRSNFEQRPHIPLIGPPGCGKTDLVRSLLSALGDECYVEFDRTATTGAGAIKELDEVEVLPRFLFLDEGEKTTDTASNFLLSLLDDRAEIRKVTARKKIQRQIKLVGIVCVNDEEDWNKLCKGALADRFGEPIYFNPPDKEMLRRICEREVTKVPGGSDAWVKPCLDYCLRRGWDRPRKVIALLIEGAEGWLDGSFARVLDATTKPSVSIPVTDWSNK